MANELIEWSHEMRGRLATVEQEKECLKGELVKTGKDLALKILALDAETQRIHALERSISWKVSAPLRWLAKTLGWGKIQGAK